MLAIINQHYRDLDIFFREEDHTYKTTNVSGLTSVTTVIKKFFGEFDADLILNKMDRFGTLGKKYPGMTKDDIKNAWALNGANARETGTALHKYIELFFNGIRDDVPENLKDEVDMFHDWVYALDSKYVPYRTEWCIYDEQLKIAGTIDMLFSVDINDPKKVAIFDWKCSKEIKKTNKYENAKYPIEHLKDCNYNHYSLQLNLYKYLLEKNYDVKVVEMNLVVIHKNYGKATVISVNDMQKEIRQILHK